MRLIRPSTEIRDMKIHIHRGANQIGGCITEIQSSSGTRILIDLGHNLPGECQKEDEYDVPDNLSALLEGVSAVIYTHNHGDHLGFFEHVPESIPQYIGEMAKEVVFNAADEIFNKAKRKGYLELIEKMQYKILRIKGFHTYEAGKAFAVGDISITPFFVSHSAADAYMMLIECDGMRILHTGDLREHGFLGKGLEPTLKRYIRHVDVLITEGTMLSRDDEQTKSESEIQKDMTDLMRRYRNVFVLCSSTNFDRLAGLHKANAQFPGRPFVCDLYQRTQLDTLSRFAGRHSDLYSIKDAEVMSVRNIYLQARMLSNGFTMLVRDNPSFRKWIRILMNRLNPEDTVLVYSQYKGYLNEQIKLQEFVKMFGDNMVHLHTSGHATRTTLAKICNVLNPSTAIIPIHKDAAADFLTLDIPNALKSKVLNNSFCGNGLEVQIN